MSHNPLSDFARRIRGQAAAHPEQYMQVALDTNVGTLESRAQSRHEDARGAAEGRNAMAQTRDLVSEFIAATATKLGIPGVAVGVWADGREMYVCHGVTSLENPLPVDQNTLYLLASITKTYTATTLMRLVADGRVELEAPVRRYVPELVLADERAAAEITVLQLLNHTAGLDWRLIYDSGEGDDALARLVARLAALPLVAPPGTRASYSQAGYDLAGRIIEKATGLTYEHAVASLILAPLGLSTSFFSRDEVMTRRFVVGHTLSSADGTLSIARMWRYARGDNPGGGLVSSVAEQLRWARFHLGDGRADSGEQVLPTELLRRMQQPTVALQSSSLGDAIGIGWFLRDVDGVRTVGHDGSANGQFAQLLMVPERNFAVVSLANADPNGIPFNQAVVRWALQTYVGVADRDREPLPYDAGRASELVGTYANDAMTFTIRTDGARLTLEVRIKPALRAASDKELPPDPPPFEFGLLPGPSDKDEYVVTSGAYKGQRGFFTHDALGAVVGLDLAGRVAQRVPTGSE
jgi:CubicO group peptidase (beta-lactamase class C family)